MQRRLIKLAWQHSWRLEFLTFAFFDAFPFPINSPNESNRKHNLLKFAALCFNEIVDKCH